MTIKTIGTLKTFLNAGAAVALALAATSCSDDDGANPDDNDNGNGGKRPLSEEAVAPRNPYLAQEHYSITHFNSAQTDAFPFQVADGTYSVSPDDCPGKWSGPVNLMTLSSNNSDYMWGMSSDRVSYIKVAGGAFELVAEHELPKVRAKSQDDLQKLVARYGSYDELATAAKSVLGQQPQFAMMCGNYVLCDKDNYAYANAVTTLLRYRLKDPNNPAAGIEIDAQLDMSPYLHGSFTLVGVSMTYDGYLVVAGKQSISIVTRDLAQVIDTYVLPQEQTLSNSICVDDKNGIYLASGSVTDGGRGLMQKIVWTGSRLSTDAKDGAWQAGYDGGPYAPAIKMGYGTGSTPTLMGFGEDEDKLVVITDGARQMKIVAFWRDEIPADAAAVDPANPRLADARTVTCGLAGADWVQSEQSVVCAGYGAFVVNNVKPMSVEIHDKIIGVLAIGPLLEPATGVERLQWNPESNRWESLWTRPDVVSISMIPSVSTASEMVFVNGYAPSTGWEVTGLDWNTGATRHRVMFGQSNRGNGAYAIIQYMPNGDLLFNSVCGPFRVRL